MKMAHARVQQWSSFTRHWWLFDAHRQCPFKASRKIIPYLQGKTKPIYHPTSDIGDHVVVINTRHVAMKNDFWRKFRYNHHTGYAGGFSVISAWRLHEMDPIQVMQRSVRSRLPGNLSRHTYMRRLHLFPDADIPDDILANVSNQIRNVVETPKRLDQYTEEEVKSFPKVFDWPEEYIITHGSKKRQES